MCVSPPIFFFLADRSITRLGSSSISNDRKLADSGKTPFASRPQSAQKPQGRGTNGLSIRKGISLCPALSLSGEEFLQFSNLFAGEKTEEFDRRLFFLSLLCKELFHSPRLQIERNVLGCFFFRHSLHVFNSNLCAQLNDAKFSLPLSSSSSFLLLRLLRRPHRVLSFPSPPLFPPPAF